MVVIRKELVLHITYKTGTYRCVCKINQVTRLLVSRVFQKRWWLKNTKVFLCPARWPRPQLLAWPLAWRYPGSARAAWTTSKSCDGFHLADRKSLESSDLNCCKLLLMHFHPRDTKSVSMDMDMEDMEDEQNGYCVLIQGWPVYWGLFFICIYIVALHKHV